MPPGVIPLPVSATVLVACSAAAAQSPSAGNCAALCFLGLLAAARDVISKDGSWALR